jgi:hypothetical protein
MKPQNEKQIFTTICHTFRYNLFELHTHSPDKQLIDYFIKCSRNRRFITNTTKSEHYIKKMGYDYTIKS